MENFLNQFFFLQITVKYLVVQQVINHGFP